MLHAVEDNVCVFRISIFEVNYFGHRHGFGGMRDIFDTRFCEISSTNLGVVGVIM
jgi:hypothetical protein